MTFRRGDIVKVDLDPIRGHEQGNYRPVLVMSDAPLPGGVNVVLPITSSEHRFPLEVELDGRTETRGVVICFQPRTLDLNARGARLIEHTPDDITDECAEYLRMLVSESVQG